MFSYIQEIEGKNQSSLLFWNLRLNTTSNADDLRIDVSLLELTVLRIDQNLAAKEEQKLQLELRAEADWKPTPSGCGA